MWKLLEAIFEEHQVPSTWREEVREIFPDQIPATMKRSSQPGVEPVSPSSRENEAVEPRPGERAVSMCRREGWSPGGDRSRHGKEAGEELPATAKLLGEVLIACRALWGSWAQAFLCLLFL